MEKKKIYITTGAIMLIASITGLLIIRARNKKEVAAIVDIIQSGVNETGTIDDLRYNKAFDPNYWQGKSQNKLGTPAQVATVAKIIYNAKGILNDDEDAVYNAFSVMQSKPTVSQVAHYFAQNYNTGLYDFLIGFLNAKEMEPIRTRIMQLPD